MNVILPSEASLHVDEKGSIRLGHSRVSLDVVVADYRGGLTADEIARRYPTVSLAAVHGALAYYLQCPDEVEAYLRRRLEEAEALRKQAEAGQPSNAELKAALLARRSRKE